MGERGNKSAAVAGKTLSATKAGDHKRDSRHLLRPGLGAEDSGYLRDEAAVGLLPAAPGWGLLSHALPREGLLSHGLHSACSCCAPAI